MRRAEDGSHDVAVVGGGAAGCAAALVSARAGSSTLLFAPPATFPPGRTAALLGGSVDLLRRLGAWPLVEADAAPLATMRLVDATRRLIRAPETTFHAREIGLSAFGYNVSNQGLLDALKRLVKEEPRVTLVETPATEIAASDSAVQIETGSETYSTRLVVAADGARSLAREAAGIGMRTWRYGQAALVATLTIARPHNSTSTEFHTEHGPFTLVPLPGERMSLVWVDRPETLEAARALDDLAFAADVERRARSIHGAMRLDSRPTLFPLGAALADRFATRRTMLVGEAAHVFPPIGAQGLNLGFRDIEALGRVLVRHRADPGAPQALAAYHAARRTDVRARTLAVDLLNRSLLTDVLPVQIARNFGLSLADVASPLRRMMMRQGLAAGIRSGG